MGELNESSMNAELLSDPKQFAATGMDFVYSQNVALLVDGAFFEFCSQDVHFPL